MDDRRAGQVAVGAALIALVWHLWFLHAYPFNFAYDSFQRWAGRDHVLVQTWLPATQAVVWAVVALGGGIEAARLALSVIAAVAVGLGARLAGRLGGGAGALLYLGVATFGPTTSVTSGIYQEGTFLLVLCAGLGLAAQGRLVAADLALGAAGLVRYEAWPYLAIWALWRQQEARRAGRWAPEAALAGWGAALWLILHEGLGLRGAAMSPQDLHDWDGLLARFDLGAWASDVGKLAVNMAQTGAWLWLGLGAWGAWLGRDRPLVRLVAAWLGVQVAFTGAWIAGLEMSSNRMQVVPVMLAALLAAPAAERIGRRPLVLRLLVLGLLGWGVWSSLDDGNRKVREFKPERVALQQMAACPDCVWWVVPRQGLGSRTRHDGCEVLQGLSPMRHGVDFWCAAWPDTAPHEAEATGRVIYNGKGYDVTVP